MSGSVGWMIIARHRETRSGEPMAYGEEGRPDSDMLMFDRGATVFSTEHSAMDALEATVEAADQRGHEWQNNYRFQIWEVKRP